MKTTLLYRLVLVMLLVPTITFATTGKGKHTKEKSIKKEFNVSSNATLKIDNSYGNLDINTWNEDRIVIEVFIKTNGNNEEKVQQKLDEIDVEFSASNTMVSAKTKFNKNGSKSWWKWNKSNNVNMEINYVVKMPMSNNIDLSNDYGSIDVEKLEGRAEINCDYGKITTQELMAENNDITFDYTNNCYFEYINSGSINADYSGYTIAKAKNLDINADYTKSVIEMAENINYNCDYNALKIGNVNNLSGNGDYLSLRIGNVYKNVEVKADYGSIKIERMASNAGDVLIETDYTGINIGYDSGYNFSFDIELEYASLKGSDGFTFNKKRIESGEKYYQGYRGNSNSGNMIRIESEYGSVKFEQQ
ncbi:hypothetical protein RM697_03275 [Ichthyenterobacterium sp. W332]|uniref:Adhesin domain-containing protein n=1 Tax=Microcosmobacter mediterraneus TaxID=3075607 RepID=A0ABU2YKA0_9FLAO|nr:hypothetical protein [Ichthyenterobacterium sp. W332]MDT0557650.1 hypothetical protein [Ichthyenterobacterium sp. W332]